jgi:hypothetical protein
MLIKKARDKLDIFDIFNVNHNHIVDDPMQLKRTTLGGLFTILFIVSAAVLILISLLLFFMDNIVENKALIPLAII